jgi:hypothetical protein
MNIVQPDPTDVPAPSGALAWPPTRGFITDPSELFESNGEGELVLAVEDGIVAGVEDDCPLAVAIRQDRELLDLRRDLGDLYARMLDVFETALEVLTARDPRTG